MREGKLGEGGLAGVKQEKVIGEPRLRRSVSVRECGGWGVMLTEFRERLGGRNKFLGGLN